MSLLNKVKTLLMNTNLNERDIEELIISPRRNTIYILIKKKKIDAAERVVPNPDTMEVVARGWRRRRLRRMKTDAENTKIIVEVET